MKNKALLSVLLLTLNLSADTIEYDMSNNEKEIVKSQIIQNIKKHSDKLKSHGNIFQEVGVKDGGMIVPFERNEKKWMELADAVKVEENEMQQDRLKKIVEYQQKKLSEDMELLERGISAMNILSPEEGTHQLKMAIMGTTLDSEIEDGKVDTKLKEMEMVLNQLQGQREVEKRQYEIFKIQADSIEKGMMDLVGDIEKLNEKENRVRISNSEFMDLSEDNRDFKEMVNEFSNNVYLGK